mmetsp:Transcript_24200/g.50718  ORF Transcript_24200/g.50718 Transcript_24200/m.50718 type:complete len:493 (-) Transcript_24200:219-1697(-)
MKTLAAALLTVLSMADGFTISSHRQPSFSSANTALRTATESTGMTFDLDSDKNQLTVTPIKSIDGTVTLPGSKSLSNRILLLAALSEGTTRVENLLESDDIRYMLDALDTLKVPVERDAEDKTAVTVTGQAGPIDSPTPDESLELFLGNAGTAMRPLAAALCMGKGKFVLDGVPRMRERPIADLIDGMQQLGAKVTCVEETGCPPVTIDANGLGSGSASISGKMSSQFLSSMLMASPVADGEVTVSIKDELISAPYVSLTTGLMKKFGVNVEVEGEMDGGTPSFVIGADEKYTSPKSILVEGDASSASYFLAGAAITGGTITVRGCGSESVQGDVAFADVLEQMGATVTWAPESITVTRDPDVKLKGVDVDCGKIPDAAMTLAVAALFCEGPMTIRNVYSWRLKETERMKAIVAECTKLGATVEEFEDYCIIHPPKDNVVNEDVVIETYDDHRMAMTFSLAACAGVNVVIDDPGCTAKTFPTYFEMLGSVAS